MLAKEIWPADTIAKSFMFSPNLSRFGPLGKVNVIVGPNNSGKSLLLRSLVESISKRNYVPASVTSKELLELRNDLSSRTGELEPVINAVLVENIHAALNEVVVPVAVSRELNQKAIRKAGMFNDWTRRGDFSDEDRRLSSLAAAYFKRLASHCTNEDAFQFTGMKTVYVPTLRSFRAPDVKDDFYAQRTTQDYFSGSGTKPWKIFTGGSMNQVLIGLLLGDRRSRNLVREFETFLGHYFFDGQQITLVPKTDGSIEIKVGYEVDRNVALLGDGLQHLITMLFAAFQAEEPIALLIEEPELFLHPGFQTRLLDSLLDRRLAHAQVFATSHSNHFINLSIDRQQVAVFRIRKELEEVAGHEERHPKFHVSALSIDDRSILTDLGVQRASVLLSNCVIFVEGPTDRLYYQRFLDIYCDTIKTPRFLPDLHYSFLEYGGSNITSYSFATEGGIRHDRLVGDEVLIITDKDKDKWKAERRERIKAAVQGTLICPEALEIENLLSPAVIAKVVAEYEKKPVPALEAVKWESYRNKRLGNYLETVIGKSERRSKSGRPYSQESGTLKDKANFCMRALKYMAVEGDLTAEAMDAAKRLYEFIAQANGRPHCDRQTG